MSQFKPVTGSFLDGIAADNPSNNWGPQDWRKQFDNMKAIGMDTVIIIRVGWGDSAMYDSPTLQTTLFPEEDLVELFFAEADRVGLRLYLGMHDSHEHWLKNDWESEIEINVRLIDEMLERYGPGHAPLFSRMVHEPRGGNRVPHAENLEAARHEAQGAR